MLCVMALLVASCCAGCSYTNAPTTTPASERSPAAVAQGPYAAIATLDMQLSVDSTTTPVSLPRKLTGSRWGAIQSACAAVGSDLRPYAGESVVLTSWIFVDPPPGYPEGMTVIEHQGRVIGVFTVVDGSYEGIPKSSLGPDQGP